jgi:hypothetical protein
MRAALDLCLRFSPCDCGLLAQAFFGRFSTAQVVSRAFAYRFTGSLQRCHWKKSIQTP